MSNRPAIAVGVDGSEQAFTAASWALDAAARRHVPLHVVHSWSIPLPPVGLGPAPVGLSDDRIRDAAQAVLDDAVTRLQATAPDVTITGSPLPGNPDGCTSRCGRAVHPGRRRQLWTGPGHRVHPRVGHPAGRHARPLSRRRGPLPRERRARPRGRPRGGGDRRLRALGGRHPARLRGGVTPSRRADPAARLELPRLRHRRHRHARHLPARGGTLRRAARDGRDRRRARREVPGRAGRAAARAKGVRRRFSPTPRAAPRSWWWGPADTEASPACCSVRRAGRLLHHAECPVLVVRPGMAAS